jgi:hypothetical protein
MYGVILRWLVGCTWLGVCVLCSNCRCDSLELPQCLQSSSSQLTLVGELKEITESFEKLDSGVSIDMTI